MGVVDLFWILLELAQGYGPVKFRLKAGTDSPPQQYWSHQHHDHYWEPEIRLYKPYVYCSKWTTASIISSWKIIG